MKGLINVEKIKLSLVSGSSLEKPLVTAFKGNNGVYVVLDNEMNGTMGLPIILVSKLENNKLVKIVDQNEWNAVKENLRMIIAGNQVDYVGVDPALSADDVFYLQLTLPVASFEALKNNYNPNGVNSVASGAMNESAPIGTPIADVAPAASSMPDVPVTPEATPVSPVTPPNIDAVASEPVMPQVANPMPDVVPVAEPVAPVTPTVEPTPVVSPEPVTPMPNVTPVMPEPPQGAQVATVMNEPVAPAVPVEPSMPSTPLEDDSSSNDVPVDFTADKEAFLKACENMFDALVAKFNK